MSRISNVLKSKNKIEKSQRARRKEELQNLTVKASYKASLNAGLQQVRLLLDSGEFESVVIQIPEKDLVMFSEAIYSEELAEYDITQVSGKSDEFMIKYKLI